MLTIFLIIGVKASKFKINLRKMFIIAQELKKREIYHKDKKESHPGAGGFL